MATLHRTPAGRTVVVKGAPEVVLASCALVETATGPIPLDDAGRAAVLAAAKELAAGALRVLALARKPGGSLEAADSGLTLLGLTGMIDPPRPEVFAAIRTCETAGIRAMMITGDHPDTAQAVARELGLLRQGRVVIGVELDGWDDAQLAREVDGVDVFARVSPAHKLRVVTALQAKGHIVAMTGDGVNDAPSLRKADIGIAMGITGTDVSRDAAAMTLTDDSFASIVAAVEEGRRVFGNIKKYLMYLLSSNIGEIGLMVGTVMLGMPLPLTAVQILYVNLATDGLPALALAVDPPDDELMQRHPRDAKVGIFTRPVVALMGVGGLWSTVVNVGLFAWATRSGRGLPEAMSMTFISLVLIQFFKAYNFRSDRRSVWHRPFANTWLNIAIGWELVLIVLILYVPFLRTAVRLRSRCLWAIGPSSGVLPPPSCRCSRPPSGSSGAASSASWTDHRRAVRQGLLLAPLTHESAASPSRRVHDVLRGLRDADTHGLAKRVAEPASNAPRRRGPGHRHRGARLHSQLRRVDVRGDDRPRHARPSGPPPGARQGLPGQPRRGDRGRGPGPVRAEVARTLPGAVALERVSGFGLAASGERSAGVALLGVDPEREAAHSRRAADRPGPPVLGQARARSRGG